MSGDYISRFDDGCAVHPHCLTCPREWCIYDDDAVARGLSTPGGVARAERMATVVALYAAGMKLEAIAARTGLAIHIVAQDVTRARIQGVVGRRRRERVRR